MLSWLTKMQVRAVARRTWIESSNVPQLAEELFRQQYAKASEATINELLSLAMALWQHWIDTGASEPSVVASGDEPMGFEE